ncbi:MAG: hypothetical protein IIU58_06795 [Clostridia bacterium]|nr:hypothetical protein [Clostridia bacterium]
MRFVIRSQPIIKSCVYALLCLCLLLFSSSFFPALRLTHGVPVLLVAAISLLARFEGIRYASFFAVIFGAAEAFMLGKNTLVYPLFYLGFAFGCMWLFENFFVTNFFAWYGYTLCGIAVYLGLSLFAPVSDWGVTAAELLFYTTLPSFVLSAALSLPLYPVFAKVKRKTG